MKAKNKKGAAQDPLHGMMKTGTITYQDAPYDVMLSREGDIAFVSDGKWVSDPALQNALMDYLLQANQPEQH